MSLGHCCADRERGNLLDAPKYFLVLIESIAQQVEALPGRPAPSGFLRYIFYTGQLAADWRIV